MGASKFIRRAFCSVVRASTRDTGEWSEAKFGTLLFGHCPFYRFDFSLDPHKIIAVELARGSGLNAFDQGAAPADELVT
jgi:hypothetical protein